MFECLTIETEEPLRLLLKQSESALFESIQNVNYPNSLKRDDAIAKWRQKYKEIDRLNKDLLDNINRKAGVYSLFSSKGKRQWQLLYIGQTQSKTASSASQKFCLHYWQFEIRKYSTIMNLFFNYKYCNINKI